MACYEITLYFRVSSIFDLFNLYGRKNQATATGAAALWGIYHSSSWPLILSFLWSAGLVRRLFEWLVRWHEIIGNCDPIHCFLHLFHVIACCWHVEWNCVARTPSWLVCLDLTGCRSWVSRSFLFSNKRICRHLCCLVWWLGFYWQRIPRIPSRNLLGRSIRIRNVGRWSNR